MIQQQQQSVPLNILIQQLLDSCRNPNQIASFNKLNYLMAKKNLQPKKIDQHVYHYFLDLQCDFRVIFDMLMELMKVFDRVPSRQHFKSHIFAGFKKYFIHIKLNSEEREEGYSKLEKIDYGILQDYLEVFINVQLKNKYKDKILDKVDEYINSKQLHKFKRALRILSSLNLKQQIRIQQIIRQVKNFISIIKFGQIMFYFKKDQIQLCSQLINELSYLKRKQSDNFVIDIIKKYKLDYQDYPQIMLNLERKGIAYNYREYPLYFCEDKFSQEPKYLAHLVLLLIEDKGLEIAQSIVDKYGLQDHIILEDKIDRLKKIKSLQLANVLRDNDSFGATELRVIKTATEDYLELMDFNIDESDVIWVDEYTNNLKRVGQTLMKSKFIGFDVETSGGIHCFQNNIDEILQIATESKIFVFDILSLSRNKQFVQLIEKIFIEQNDQIVIGHSCIGDLKVIHSLVGTNRKVKKIADIQNIFKQEGKAKAGLKDIVKRVYGKAFSKYEQCSGWVNRPLRRAQMHYAALDAFVLIKLYKKEGLEQGGEKNRPLE